MKAPTPNARRALYLQDNLAFIEEVKKRLNHARGAIEVALAPGAELTAREVIALQRMDADLDGMENACEAMLENIGIRFDRAEKLSIEEGN